MQTLAVLVPPADVLVKVHSVVTGVPPVADQPAETKRGFLGFGRRKPEPVLPAGPMLAPVPPEAMHLVVARFGNLAMGDVLRLADALDREGQEWPTPRLHLAGGQVTPSDGSVWANIGGDTDQLAAITRGVHGVAQGLHLFVDRRGFRAELQVASTTPDTSQAYLDAVVAALEGYEGGAFYQSSVALVSPIDAGPGQLPFRVHRDVQLGPAVVH